jgi:hypothetical protein
VRRMISRSDGAFSQREMVGCEQRSSGRRPQASFKAGIEPEPIEVVAVRVAAARSPTRSPRTSPSSHVSHTVAWAPAFNAAIRGKSTTSNAAGTFLRETDGKRKLGWLSSVMAGYARSTLCSENPEAAQKRNASNGYVSAGRKKKNEGKRSSQAKCSEEINRFILLRGRLRYDHRVALRVNFS